MNIPALILIARCRIPFWVVGFRPLLEGTPNRKGFYESGVKIRISGLLSILLGNLGKWSIRNMGPTRTSDSGSISGQEGIGMPCSLEEPGAGGGGGGAVLQRLEREPADISRGLQ